jgi:hypothetical protein
MLPLYALAPALGVLTAVFLFALWKAPGLAARFVVFAIWTRLILSALHRYTYPKILAGQSINALFSVFVVGVGFLIIRKALLLHKAALPIYLLLGVTVLSAVASSRVVPAFDDLVKYLYFLVVALATYQALANDDRDFGLAALLAFSPLVLLQLISIALRIPKVATDGSLSYIGGYNHEAAFSVALVGLFFVACLAGRVNVALRAAAMMAAVIGIVFANYRTAILGIVPLGFYVTSTAGGRWLEPKLRAAIIIVAAALVTALLVYALAISNRFVDVRGILLGQSHLFQPPESFTTSEHELLNGRAYIWSQYLYTWARGTSLQHLFGFGPDSWEQYFRLYAHNSFIGILFDEGLLGVTALVTLLVVGFAMAIRCGESAPRLVAAHLSFFVLNLATMPFWLVEGLIVYGYLWGHTMSAYYRRAPRRSAIWPPVHAAKFAGSA